MRNEYLDLLKLWCDKLLTYQIREIDDPALAGGLLCPVCHRLHGRSADLLPALVLLAKETGDVSYLDAARRLFDWSERNLKRADGGMFNDSNHKWNGITVFSAISIGETLLANPDLPGDFRDALRQSLIEKADFVAADRFIDPLHNVNYPASSPAALEYAYRITGNKHCREVAEARYRFVMENFVADDGTIIGEGKPFLFRTPRGCGAVDVGYNLTETCSNLAVYAVLSGDAEKQAEVANLCRAGLSFLLPDGAIDNSFGARAEKWTYYGSRTSDGAGIGWVRLAALDPAFGEAAERNFRLMRECTVNGLLAGGRMYGDAGESACLHHSITHSKTLAAMAAGFDRKNALLPCDKSDGAPAVYHKTAGILRISRGGWIASVENSDFPLDRERFPGSGGSLSLLYHRAAGAILTASMMKFSLSEPNNMQFPRKQEGVDCTTPRVSLGDRNSAQDRAAELTWSESGTETVVSVHGHLTGMDGGIGESFRLVYAFRENELEISAMSDAPGAEFLFFPISDAPAPLCVTPASATLSRSGKQISVVSRAGALTVAPKRRFHPAGGFLFFPMSVPVPGVLSPILTIRVDV